jgi:hypothetical protein
VDQREVVSFRVWLVSLVIPAPPVMAVSMLLPVSRVMAVESAAPVRSPAIPPSRDDLHAASDKAIREPRMNVEDRFMVSLPSAAPRRHHRSRE